ncbi:MAG: hypothetical protein FWD11_02485 [Micrococcales bacterium]|nr:hypothetical protein [Micrococcales bacterium]
METTFSGSKLIMYPSFGDVFETDDLLGVFYPLCTVVDERHGPLHFVSSNGLWMDDTFATDANTHAFTVFRVVEGKYQFDGDLRLYTGAGQAKSIFPLLEEDLAAHGDQYLAGTDGSQAWYGGGKEEAEAYVERMRGVLPDPVDGFDMDYYLETFYAFSSYKRNYSLTGKFRSDISVRHRVGGGHVVSGTADGYTMEMLWTEDGTEPTLLDNRVDIGMVIGSEFFQDGNDAALYYGPDSSTALIVNCYS